MFEKDKITNGTTFWITPSQIKIINDALSSFECTDEEYKKLLEWFNNEYEKKKKYFKET